MQARKGSCAYVLQFGDARAVVLLRERRHQVANMGAQNEAEILQVVGATGVFQADGDEEDLLRLRLPNWDIYTKMQKAE